MLTWLTENLATIIICMILAAVIVLVIISMVRRKKKGKSSCGCNCAGCPMNSSCHHEK